MSSIITSILKNWTSVYFDICFSWFLCNWPSVWQLSMFSIMLVEACSGTIHYYHIDNLHKYTLNNTRIKFVCETIFKRLGIWSKISWRHQSLNIKEKKYIVKHFSKTWNLFFCDYNIRLEYPTGLHLTSFSHYEFKEISKWVRSSIIVSLFL